VSVYFLRAGKRGPVKIGYAENPWRRLGQLQTIVPEKLIMLAIVPGGREVERHYHSAFSDSHLRGEWFLLTDAMENFLLEQDRCDIIDHARTSRPKPSQEAKDIWLSRSIPTDRAAAAKAGFNPQTLQKWFGKSRRKRRWLTSDRARELSVKANAAKRAKALATRLPATDAEAVWRNMNNYPTRADAIKAMPGWSIMKAWRAFGPREI
jgi:hypothetical protein